MTLLILGASLLLNGILGYREVRRMIYKRKYKKRRSGNRSGGYKQGGGNRRPQQREGGRPDGRR